MDDKQKLLELIEEVELGISPEEAKDLVNSMAEDKVSEFIPLFEDLIRLEDQMEQEAQKANPEKYEEIKNQYLNELLKIDVEALEEEKQEQKKIDDKLETELNFLDAKIKEIGEADNLSDAEKEETYSAIQQELNKLN